MTRIGAHRSRHRPNRAKVRSPEYYRDPSARPASGALPTPPVIVGCYQLHMAQAITPMTGRAKWSSCYRKGLSTENSERGHSGERKVPTAGSSGAGARISGLRKVQSVGRSWTLSSKVSANSPQLRLSNQCRIAAVTACGRSIGAMCPQFSMITSVLAKIRPAM